MTLSPYLATQYIAHALGITAIGSAPITLYLGFLDADGVTEITSTYLASRTSYTASDFTAPVTLSSNRFIKNTVAASLGTAIAASLTGIANIGIWDASASGNLLGSFEIRNATTGIAEALTFGSGDAVELAIGQIVISLDLLFWSIYSRDWQLNWLKGTDAPSLVTTNYLGLFSGITATGGVTELTSTVASGRLAVAAAVWDTLATVSGRQQTKNINNLAYANAIAGASAFNGIGLFDALAAGNLILFSSVDQQDIVAGQPLIITAGKLEVSQG